MLTDRENPPTTTERILDATLEVLARSGPRKLSLSDVATTAGVSRPTLYHWFASKEALLDAFGRYEQDKYDRGLAAAVAGLEGVERLDAVLRHIVDFQQSYSLRRMVDVEPTHVVHQMTRVLPIMRDRLEPLVPGDDAATVASVVTRVALSHALIPDDDPELFYAELRHAAGLSPVDGTRRHRSRRPSSRVGSSKERR
ncbi:MAG: helix-turn-helix domain-containing protein [Acidimicrobiales bacterium]